ADAAGVEKGHITYYFKTKDELLFEIVDDLHQQFLDGLDSWLARPHVDTESTLRYVFECHVVLCCQLHMQTRVSYESMRFLSARRYAAVAAKRHQYEVRLRDVIDDARRRIPIADVSTNFLVNAILGMLNWPYQWYSPMGPDSPAVIARLLAARVLAAL